MCSLSNKVFITVLLPPSARRGVTVSVLCTLTHTRVRGCAISIVNRAPWPRRDKQLRAYAAAAPAEGMNSARASFFFQNSCFEARCAFTTEEFFENNRYLTICIHTLKTVCSIFVHVFVLIQFVFNHFNRILIAKFSLFGLRRLFRYY